VSVARGLPATRSYTAAVKATIRSVIFRAAVQVRRLPSRVCRPDERGPRSTEASQVLRLLATGKTNRAIADELFISERTVYRELPILRRRLKLDSSPEAPILLPW
jgi:DNA-binding NarL/FixJ family response regulator